MRRTIILITVLLLVPTLAAAQALQRQAPHSILPLPPRPERLPAPPPGDGWVWVPPVYRTVYKPVWVPPTYRTVYDRVWQDPTYETITDTVWIPDQYGWRTTGRWEDGRYVERQEWALLTPGHCETRTRRVMTSPGGWTLTPRQIELTPGHWSERLVRELITPGHWERRGAPIDPPPTRPNPQPTPRPPGLEPFSPLWDWPADK